MITEAIRKELTRRANKKVNLTTKLNFKGLIKLIDKSDVEFVDADLNYISGMATINKIYLDLDTLGDDQLCYFIILHEYCHALRIKKVGKDATIASLSLEDFDEMAEHILYEEVLADRYATLMFYQLNKEIFPYERTQGLNEERQRENYKFRIKPLHGVIQNSEEKYYELMNTFINDGLD